MAVPVMQCVLGGAGTAAPVLAESNWDRDLLITTSKAGPRELLKVSPSPLV